MYNEIKSTPVSFAKSAKKKSKTKGNSVRKKVVQVNSQYKHKTRIKKVVRF